MDTRAWIMSCYSKGEYRYNFVDDFYSVMERTLSGGDYYRDGLKDMINRLWRGRNHMWPNDWVQCRQCNEDWTVDPRRKNLRYHQQDLHTHLNSFFHTRLAQWLRGQDWVLRNSGRGWMAGVMCPYCFQMGVFRDYQNLELVEEHIRTNSNYEEDVLARTWHWNQSVAGGWRDLDWDRC